MVRAAPLVGRRANSDTSRLAKAMTSETGNPDDRQPKDAQLERLIDETPFMMTRCSRDLRYLFVSRAYAKMLGRSPTDIEGKPIVEIMGDDGFAVIRPHVQRVLRGERVEFESAVTFAGVGPRFLRVGYTPDRDRQGQVIGWIASILDITDQHGVSEARALVTTSSNPRRTPSSPRTSTGSSRLGTRPPSTVRILRRRNGRGVDPTFDSRRAPIRRG